MAEKLITKKMIIVIIIIIIIIIDFEAIENII
jgi:hypothetical protein